MFVHDLLEAIPPDTAPRVQRVAQRWQQRVRRLLADDVLRWRLRHRGRGPNQDATIQLRTGTGKNPGYVLPEGMGDREIPEGHEAAALLALFRPATRRLTSGATDLLALFTNPAFEARVLNGMALEPGGVVPVLDQARALGEHLEAVGAPHRSDDHAFDLARYLLDVDTDVLGIYGFDAHEGAFGRVPNPTGEVRLYWGAIGLIAQCLDVTIEHLALVTLAHELAHGYTHLGADRDGRRWTGEDFGRSDVGLVECLAQYYTHLVCERLEPDAPGLMATYHTLLARQSIVYQLHLPLLVHSTPERVASTAAQLRKGPADWHVLARRLGIGSIVLDDEGLEALRSRVREMRILG